MNVKITLVTLLYLLLCAHGAEPEATTTETAKDATTEAAETTTATSATPATGKSYGSNCTKNEDCDETIGLTCNKGECDCARPKEMRYNNETNSCVVLDSFSCEKIPGMKMDQFNCTKHATCKPKGNGQNQQRACTCDKGYSANVVKECKGDFETNCNNDDEECNEFAMLMCHIAGGETIGKCGCYHPKENVYENGKCIALAGASCTHNTPPYILACTSNATCVLENNALTKNTTGTCVCNKGTVQLQNKRCGAKGNVPRIASNEALITLMACFITLVFNVGVK